MKPPYAGAVKILLLTNGKLTIDIQSSRQKTTSLGLIILNVYLILYCYIYCIRKFYFVFYASPVLLYTNVRENGRDKQKWTTLEKTEQAGKNGQFQRKRKRQTRMNNSRENGIGKQKWKILEKTEEANKNEQFQRKRRDKQEWTILEKTEETKKNGQFQRKQKRQRRIDNSRENGRDKQE